MSVLITSSNSSLNDELSKIQSDGLVDIKEFQGIRDEADAELNKISNEKILEIIKKFQTEVDEVVESLQKIALLAKKNKLSSTENESLMSAVEHQVSYLVMGYKSSVERLNLFNHK